MVRLNLYNSPYGMGPLEEHREIKTQKEFAESVGISEDTLTAWKNHPQFSLLVWQFTKQWLRNEYLMS